MSEFKSNKDFENARRERLKEKTGIGKKEENPPVDTNNEGSENNSEKSEKKLDIDEKNSYITDTQDTHNGKPVEKPTDDKPSENTESADDEVEKLKSVLENTFGGDPLKAAKSWKEAQSYAAQLRQQLKQLEKENDNIYGVIEKNPELEDLINKAYQGEDIKNFLRSKEPQSKPDSSAESKLDSSTISEKMLTEAGYISPSELEFLSDAQRAEKLNQARILYQQNTLPQTIAQKAAEEFQRQIEERERKQAEEKTKRTNQELNQTRWKSGIEEAAETFGLHFAGQDAELLDDIEKYAKYYRDPDNPNVIDEKAVYLAAQRVLQLKGRDAIPRNYKKTIEEAKKNADGKFDTGFNVSKRQSPRPQQPQSLFDKMRQRRIEQSNKSIEKRYSHRRTDN